MLRYWLAIRLRTASPLDMRKIRALDIGNLIAVLMLTACASAEVHPDAPSSAIGAAHYPSPHAIYYTVDTTSHAGAWKNAADDASNNWPSKVQVWFGEQLPKELGGIAPTSAYSGNANNGWLVQVTVTYFDPGSATARIWIGGGAGQSKLKTHVNVYDLDRSTSSPILSFETYGDSGNYSSLYEQAAVGTGPGKDIWRTCREIRGYLGNVTEMHNIH